jgi:hypothetical protein
VQGPYGSVTSPTQLGFHPNCVVGSRLYYAGTLCQAIRACTDVASPSPISGCYPVSRADSRTAQEVTDVGGSRAGPHEGMRSLAHSSIVSVLAIVVSADWHVWGSDKPVDVDVVSFALRNNVVYTTEPVAFNITGVSAAHPHLLHPPQYPPSCLPWPFDVVPRPFLVTLTMNARDDWLFSHTLS